VAVSVGVAGIGRTAGVVETHSTWGTTAPDTTTWRINACCPAGHESSTGAEAADCTPAGATGVSPAVPDTWDGPDAQALTPARIVIRAT
jgi:hypothetical protein